MNIKQKAEFNASFSSNPDLLEISQAYLDLLAWKEKAEEVLRFYADENNYDNDDWGVKSILGGDEYGKPGKKARDLLGEE